ncbi:MAG: ribosome biogenesis GTPase Der [Planctomycetota bacterium]
MSVPVVAIVGRPNVGKSTLLNAILKKRISIEDPTPGTTRDRVSARATIEGRMVEIVDTGGIVERDKDPLAKEVQKQVDLALKSADVIVFVVDVRIGVTAFDSAIAARLRRASKPIILVANKVDTPGFRPATADFYQLGFGEPLAVSAKQKVNVDMLREAVVAALPKADEADMVPELKLAIVGRRNVGKSTLVNYLAHEERVIVSEIAGTTRDAVDVRFEKDGHAFIAIDTAGLRKRARVDSTIEKYTRIRAQQAIRRADVVLFVVDASEPLSVVDKHLGQEIEEAGKPVVVVVNKWDLARAKKVNSGQYIEYMNARFPGIAYAPVAFLSAKKGENVWEAFEIARQLHIQSGTKVSTHQLNEVLQQAQNERTPPSPGGRLPRVFYGTQAGTHPPRFIIFVNYPEAFTGEYRRYLIGKIRKNLPFAEVPVVLWLRGRTRASEKSRREHAVEGEDEA